jgi:ACT domain-containing protein
MKDSLESQRVMYIKKALEQAKENKKGKSVFDAFIAIALVLSSFYKFAYLLFACALFPVL